MIKLFKRSFPKSFLKLGFFCLLIFCVFNSKAQAQNFQLIAKIDTLTKFASVDNFGNLFVVTPKNEVLKFNPKGQFLWNYTNNSFGNITQIDVSDPLRVILFYAAFQQIVVLNNNLSEISAYSFNQNPTVQITLVASANNNGFWVYDQINRELKKLTNAFTDDLSSGNIYQRNGFDMQAKNMISDEQHVYIDDALEGIRIFDLYGNFIKSALLKTSGRFDVSGNLLYYFNDQKLKSFALQTFEEQEIKLPIKGPYTHVSLRFNRLVVLNEKGLTLWAVKTN